MASESSFVCQTNTTPVESLLQRSNQEAQLRGPVGSAGGVGGQVALQEIEEEYVRPLRRRKLGGIAVMAKRRQRVCTLDANLHKEFRQLTSGVLLGSCIAGH